MLRSAFAALLFVAAVAAQTKHLTVIVEPAAAIRGMQDTVCIAGGGNRFGNWRPDAVRMQRSDDGAWTYSTECDSGRRVEFKITAGSWESEARYDSSGRTPANTAVLITNDTIVILRPLLWKRYILPAKPEAAIRGTVHYHRQMEGPGLHHRRDVIVWLPPSYERNQRKHYPVLYMHDGQNLFDPTTAFTGYDWRVDEVADSLIKLQKMEETIIVGIYNSPDRLPEYSDSPLGQAYLHFVADVLKPFIDSIYRTKPGKEHTGIMGSSLGGLSSLWFAWRRPEVFGMAGCLSSSFWYDDERTLKEVREYQGPKKHIRIYLDCGGREKELMSGYKRMVEILKTKGYVKGRDLEYTLDPKGTHSEYYWAKRVWRPLMFMYRKK